MSGGNVCGGFSGGNVWGMSVLIWGHYLGKRRWQYTLSELVMCNARWNIKLVCTELSLHCNGSLTNTSWKRVSVDVKADLRLCLSRTDWHRPHQHRACLFLSPSAASLPHAKQQQHLAISHQYYHYYTTTHMFVSCLVGQSPEISIDEVRIRTFLYRFLEWDICTGWMPNVKKASVTSQV